MTNDNKVGRWWQPLEDKRLICNLCPRYCRIPEGSHGFCFVRKNFDGRLIAAAYGTSTGFAVDPIEKKPLYHFYPGSNVLSFGTVGCNLGCKFCQNWHISKSKGRQLINNHFTTDQVVELALKNNCHGIAYTYNDPVIFGEWVIDIADQARKSGLKNILVSNGYINPEARDEVYGCADAINLDLKSFSNDFYRHLTLSELEPVLDTLRWVVHETSIWLEITMLVIPDENDSRQEIGKLSGFIANELNPDIPLHFSAFHPDYKLTYRERTPDSTLKMACDIAVDNGLNHVYIGNTMMNSGNDTICGNCHKTVIKRVGFSADSIGLSGNGCGFCGSPIPGRF